jgi:hypothetical protein
VSREGGFPRGGIGPGWGRFSHFKKTRGGHRGKMFSNGLKHSDSDVNKDKGYDIIFFRPKKKYFIFFVIF